MDFNNTKVIATIKNYGKKIHQESHRSRKKNMTDREQRSRVPSRQNMEEPAIKECYYQ